MENLFTTEPQRAQRKDMTLTAETQRRRGNNPGKSPLIPLLQSGRLLYSPLWQRGGRGVFLKSYKTIALFIVMLFISSCGGGGGGSSTAPSNTVSFSGNTSDNVYMARNSSLSSGSTLAIDIKVNNVTSVYGAAFDVDFDSTKMTYSSYETGSFLEAGGNNVTYNIAPQAGNSGKLIIGASRQGSSGGATGSGTLVTLKFNVTNGCSVSFSSNELLDSSDNTISASWSSGGTVTVQ